MDSRLLKDLGSKGLKVGEVKEIGSKVSKGSSEVKNEVSKRSYELKEPKTSNESTGNKFNKIG